MDNILKNRVESNTKLAKDNGIMAVYEAITNAIQAIEETQSDNGKIIVNIISDTQKRIDGGRSATRIQHVEIIDNGIGFTEENLSSFNKLDSEYKKDKGCHGIGRLMYLKVFDFVTISSVFYQDGKYFKREIRFDFEKEVQSNTVEIPNFTNIATVVKLHGLKQDFSHSFPKTLKIISQNILEHFYAYFFSETPPDIVVTLAGKTQSLLELYDTEASQNVHREEFDKKGIHFDITHVRKRQRTLPPKIHYLADYRQVLSKDTQIKGLTKNLSDKDGKFSYACYVSSSYLNENINSERGDFALPKQSDAFSLSLSDITAEVEKRIKDYLATEINSEIAHKVADIKGFIRENAPEYSLLLTKLTDDKFYEDIDVSKADDVEPFLHSLQYQVEKETLAKGKKLREQTKDYDFKEKIQEYMQDIEDVQKMDLASYVCHRKVVIDTLSALLDSQSSTQEADFHNLIFKQYTKTPSNSNLWLINDEFMYYRGVSEGRLRDLTYKGELLIPKDLTAIQDDFLNKREGELKGLKRPDILLFPDEGKCILLELKDKAVKIENHLNQLNIYAGIILNCSNFQIKTFHGLLIGENYRVDDVLMADSNYGYDDTLNAMVESEGRGRPVRDFVNDREKREDGIIYNKIVKYSDILKQAKMRNSIFFEKLGLR